MLCNKSHAAVYAVIAYATAWLKYYYPTEFMAANMDEKRKDQALLARYIKHCKNDLGIEMEVPSINESVNVFLPLPGKRIVFSLAAKDTSSDVLKRLLDERVSRGRYLSMQDFIDRSWTLIDRKTLKALAHIGAFDEFKMKRSSIVAGVDDFMDAVTKCKSAIARYAVSTTKRKKATEEPSLKKWVPDIPTIFPNISEFPDEILLRMEKYHNGVYLSGHPLDKFQCSIGTFSSFKLSDITYDVDEETGMVLHGDGIRDDQKVQLIAQIVEIKALVTKKDKRSMAVLQIEDRTGGAKALLFPEAYESCHGILAEDAIYRIKGYLKISDDEVPFIAINAMALLEDDLHKRVIFDARNELNITQQFLSYILSLKCKGECPVYVKFGSMRVLLRRQYWVDIKQFEEACREDVKARCVIREW